MKAGSRIRSYEIVKKRNTFVFDNRRNTKKVILRNYLATEFTESTEIWKQKMEKNLTLHRQNRFPKRSPFPFGF